MIVPTRRVVRRRRPVVGRLWLGPASADDRSPVTHERAAAPRVADDTVAFVGATDADLPRAGVYLDTTRPRVFPPPTSRDPVYPGLVVTRAVPSGRGWMLLVGAENWRAKQDVMVVDGPGAYFSVDASDGRGGFAGRWGPWGRIGAAGHFCARYVGLAPRR